MCPPTRDPACPFVSKYFSPIHTTYQSGILGGGYRVNKAENAGKFIISLWPMEKMIFDYFRSINCINVSIHGCNCCDTGIDVSKCVYLASMTVKIERTVGGHNRDILQQCIFDVHTSRSIVPQPE